MFLSKINHLQKIFILSTVLSIFLGFTNIACATEQEAKTFVNDLATRAIDVTKNPSINDAEKEKRLTDIFLKAVDTQFIAKFSLGKYYRTLLPAQQKEYMKLYSDYLINMYVPNFRKYTGNVVTVLDAKEVRPNNYVVQTELGGGTSEQNIQINYALRQDPAGIEKFVIYDIAAEGVSLITTQRDELSGVMTDNNGDYNKLADLLRQKINSEKAPAAK